MQNFLFIQPRWQPKTYFFNNYGDAVLASHNGWQMSVDRLICGCIGHKGMFVVSLQLSDVSACFEPCRVWRQRLVGCFVALFAFLFLLSLLRALDCIAMRSTRSGLLLHVGGVT